MYVLRATNTEEQRFGQVKLIKVQTVNIYLEILVCISGESSSRKEGFKDYGHLGTDKSHENA